MLQGYSGDHELQGKYTEVSQPEYLQQAGHLQPQAAQSPGRRAEFPDDTIKTMNQKTAVKRAFLRTLQRFLFVLII